MEPESLNVSIDKWRSIFIKSPDAIVVATLDGRIELINPSALDMFGYKSLEEIGERQMMDFIDPSHFEKARQQIEEMLHGIFTGADDFLVVKKDGTRFFVDVNGEILEDSGGIPTNFMFIIRDITNRKKIEQALSASESDYQKLYQMIRLMSDTMPDMMWAKDLEKRYIFTNRSICEKLLNARNTSEPIGKTDLFFALRERNSRPDDPEWHTFGELCMDSDEVTLKEMKEMHFDEYGNVRGKFLYLDVNKAPLFDSEGKLIGVVGSARDITERKQVEEAIRKSEIKYRTLTETISLGIYRTTVGPEGRFIEVNPAMIKMFGYDSKEELMAISVSDLYQNPKDRNKFNDRMLKEGFVKGVELSLKKKDGSLFIGSVSVVAVRDKRDQVIYYDGVIDDITERKHAEEALIEGESRFRTLFESANDALFLMDQEIFIDCNPKTLEMFGCTREQIIGQPPFVFSPDYQPDGRLSVEKAMEKIEAAFTGQPQFFEWQHCRSDRTLFDAEVSLNVFYNKGKKYLQAIVRDITKRKQVEKTISILAHAVRSVSECISITDMEDRIIFVNPAFLHTYQYTEDELIGKPISMVRSLKNPPEYVKRIIPETLQGGWHGELVNIRKDGSEFPVNVSTSVIRDENGHPLALIGVTTDITDRKRAEEELHASELRNKALLSAIPDLMFMFSRDGIFMDFHASDTDLLIMKPELFLGRRINDVLPAELAAETLSRLNKVFKKGRPEVYEYDVKMGNETRIFESRIVPCGKDLALSIVRDISDRKKMESQMIQTERMAALGEMSAGMAHEINQPLNTLSILFDNILLEAKEKSGVSEDYLVSKSDKIFNNILRIKNIIDHVREFSRSTEGYFLAPFNINESVTNALSMVTEQYKMAGISLVTNYDENLPVIQGNTYKFERIILNLIINSKDALIEKKNILRKDYPMTIRITTRFDNENIYLDVEDNGAGIKDEHKDKILQPFYTTKETGKGTGLGLSISYGLIREMNGEIDIRSKAGEYTIVTVIVPHQTAESSKSS